MTMHAHLLEMCEGLFRIRGGAGHTSPARRVEILEPGGPGGPLDGAIALAVGYDEGSVLSSLEGILSRGAAALVIRPDLASEQVQTAAQQTGVPLMIPRKPMSWTELFRVLHGAVTSAVSAEGAPFGGGIDSLDALAHMLGTDSLGNNPVTIENSTGALLSYSPHQTEIDEPRRRSILAGYSPPDVLGALRRKGILHAINTSEQPVRFHEAGLGLSPRVAMAIKEQDVVLGYLWVMEHASRLEQERLDIVRHAAVVAAGHIVRRSYEQAVQIRIRQEMLQDLLSGDITSPELIASRARKLGLEPDEELDVLLADVDIDRPLAAHIVDAPPGSQARRLGDLLTIETRAIHQRAVLAPNEAGVLIVVPVEGRRDRDQDPEAVAERILRVAREVAGASACVGVGGRARGLHGLAEAFQRAAHAVDVGKRLGRNERAVTYDELGIYRLLTEPTNPNSRTSLSPVVDRLEIYDDEKGTDFLRTLGAYLDNFGDRMQTAQDLRVHHNTLAYRLKRVEEIAEFSLSDPDVRLAVQLELRARALQSGAA